MKLKKLRDDYGLKKSSAKLSNKFEAHCVDSWILANDWVGGHTKPDNKKILLISLLRFHRRQLHSFQSKVGGVRRPYGSTRSCGFKRGSLVKYPKWGLAYVGGTTGVRLAQNINPNDCIFLAYNSWRIIGN